MELEKIFRSYDVRGNYPQEIDENVAYLFGKAFGTLYPDKKIVVGWDARLSSPSLKDNLVKGLVESGIEVTDIGMVPTPVIYFACYKLGYEMGIMVTGSHLTKEFNGFKVCNFKGIPIGYETGLNKIKETIKKGKFSEGKGKLNKRDIKKEYINFIKSFGSNFNETKVVVDATNGSAGKIYSQALKEKGAEVIELYCEPNGNFPNHIPDPMNKEFIVDLKKEVKEKGADLGFGFDSDGDRLNIVDGKGNLINTNHIFSLLIEDKLKNEKGKVIHDVLCSKLVDDVTKENGGTPIIWKVGHTYIANKCLEERAVIAGEVSGHYFFKETSYADDVLIACMRILSIMKEEGKNLSELTSKYPKYYSYSDRVYIKEEEKFKFIESLKKKFEEKSYDLITLDGVRVNFNNGWALFRPSNTEAKISIGAESSEKEEFEKIKDLVDEVIKEIPK